MARTGPVKALAPAMAKYTQGVSSGGQNWNNGIQGCQVNPMALASQQSQKAISNYSTALGPNGSWVQKMQSLPATSWKTPASNTISKYTGSAQAGGAKWGRWWSAEGMSNAQAVRNTASANRAAGMLGVDRAVAAINQMQALGRRAGEQR